MVGGAAGISVAGGDTAADGNITGGGAAAAGIKLSKRFRTGVVIAWQKQKKLLISAEKNKKR